MGHFSQKNFTVDHLRVEIFNDRRQVSKAAALAVADELRHLAANKEKARMIFAAAPSQNELLESLSTAEEIQWEKIAAFHMDEYSQSD